MTDNTDYTYFNHAQQWAMKSRRMNAAQASAYASWYVDQYPNGDKSHVDAFELWMRYKRVDAQLFGKG